MVPNFIRKQAREYMNTHGVRYQQALDAVTAQLDDSVSAAGQSNVAQLLRIPVGLTEDGENFELDLKEASRGGMGPHGLCVGDSGTGKTEFLRTLVVNACASHSPEDLNWLLAGWHSPEFKRLSDLPHVVSVVASGRDLWEVVVVELERRLGVLRDAEAKDIWDYRLMREQNAEMDPLPTLIVVVDDFDVLAGEDRTLREVFRRVGRQGRTLGVQFVLAAQPAELETGAFENVLQNISYTVMFRVGSLASRWARRGAAGLRRPGSAILQAADGECTGLQISLTSRGEKATVRQSGGESIGARSAQAAEAARNALDNASPGGDAAQKAYSAAGLDLPGDGKNLGAMVDPSDLRPGDVLKWQDKTMVAVSSWLVAHPTEPGVALTLGNVLKDQEGFEGIFRPTETDPTSSAADTSASPQRQAPQAPQGVQRSDV